MSYTEMKLNYLLDTKERIRAAIVSKGQNVPSNATFRSYADHIAAIEGKSPDLMWVTFMSHDGLTELGKKPVAVGDDCADPIARGVFGTPTRASTAQYSYSFVGWATTKNGALDSNALKNVTADRVLYAAYASVTRYYTITYLDTDGSVLKTESLAYGATPVYAPEKDGFGFEGWTPAISTVTGNASYTATWSALLTFANASWSQINEIAEAGETEKYFKVGDSKNLTFTYDGITITVPVVIAGIKHDDLADGSGKANLSIVCGKGIVEIPHRTTNPNANVAYQWSTVLRPSVQEIKNGLPSDLAAVIKTVSKTTKRGRCIDSSFVTGSLQTTSDAIWYLSETEVGVSNDGEGALYPIFTDANSRKRKATTNNKYTKYMLRSGYTSYYQTASAINTDGLLNYLSFMYFTGKGHDRAMVFGFCI